MFPTPNPLTKPKIMVISRASGIMDYSNWQAKMSEIVENNPKIGQNKFYLIYLNSANPNSIGHYYLFEYDPSKSDGSRYSEHFINGDGRCGLNAILKAQELSGLDHQLIHQYQNNYNGVEYPWLDQTLILGYQQPILTKNQALTDVEYTKFNSWLDSSLDQDDLLRNSLEQCFVDKTELQLSEVKSFLQSSKNSNLEYFDILEIFLSQTGKNKIENLKKIANQTIPHDFLENDLVLIDFCDGSQDFFSEYKSNDFKSNRDYQWELLGISKEFIKQISQSNQPLDDEKKKRITDFYTKVEELDLNDNLDLHLSIQRMKILKEGGPTNLAQELDFSKPYYDQNIFLEENKRFADLIKIPDQFLADPFQTTFKYGIDFLLDEDKKTLKIKSIRDNASDNVRNNFKKDDEILSINNVKIADIITNCQSKQINPRYEIARLMASENKLKFTLADDTERELMKSDKKNILYSGPNAGNKLSQAKLNPNATIAKRLGTSYHDSASTTKDHQVTL